MTRPRTAAEASRDLRPEPADPAPEAVRHVVDRADEHDGPPFDRCRFCGAAGRVGSINPFAECPAGEFPSAIEACAETATEDKAQASLTGAPVATDGGRSP